MTEDNEKIHWQKLKEILKSGQNGEIVIKFQDGLPVKVVQIKTERENIDLTK